MVSGGVVIKQGLEVFCPPVNNLILVPEKNIAVSGTYRCSGSFTWAIDVFDTLIELPHIICVRVCLYFGSEFDPPSVLEGS